MEIGNSLRNKGKKIEKSQSNSSILADLLDWDFMIIKLY